MTKKFVKIFVSFILSFVVVFSLCVPATAALDVRGTQTGTMQDTSDPTSGVLNWSFTYDKVKGTASLSITGDGYMPNATSDSWFDIQNEVQCYVTSLTIGEGVKSIMEGAFAYEIYLTSVKLPDSLEFIGDNAFSYTGITSLYIPEKVEYLSGRMFFNSPISSFEVNPDNPFYTSYNGDIYSKDMKSLVVGAPGKYVEDSHYQTVFPDSVTTIDSYAFYMSQITEVSIPSHIKEIRNMAFAGSSLNTLRIDSGLQKIYDSAFLACDDLYDIVIPDTVDYIGWYALGYIYDVDLAGVEYILDLHGISHGTITVYNYQEYVEQAGYSIDQFFVCVPNINAVVYSSTGSLGESYATDNDLTFSACETNYSRLVCATISQAGVLIEWIPSSNATGYRVCRKTEYNTWETIGTVSGKNNVKYVDNAPESNYINEYTVVAFNEKGDAYFDETGVSCYYLKSPELVSAVNTSTGVSINWKIVDGATKYNVYRKAAGENNWQLISYVSGNKQQYVDSSAKPNQTYSYSVSAINSSGSSLYNTKGVTITRVSVPRVAVYNIAAGIAVRWAHPYSADFFKVYRRTSSTDWVLVYTGKGTETVYVDKNFTYGKEYTYKVVAGYKSCTSDTNAVGGSVIGMQSPMKFTVTNRVSGIMVNWTKCSGAKGYYVYRRTPSTGWRRIAVINGADKVSYLDTNVSSGSTYIYTIKSFNGKYMSTYNTNGRRTIFLSTPKIYEQKSTTSGIRLKYTATQNAQGYYVYRRTPSTTWKLVGTVKNGKTTTFCDGSAKKGQTYIYTVRSYNNGVRSSYYSNGKKIKDVY